MIIINNWSSLQSYKDRKPPWIRLHKTLLDNFEFHGMSQNARALLPMLWLLASEHEDPKSGIVDACVDKIAFRLRMTKKDVIAGITENNDAGFIQQKQACNETVTKPLQDRNETVTPETETETETETYCVNFESIWKRYPSKIDKARAEKIFNKTVKTEAAEKDINKALDIYLDHLAKETWKKARGGAVWFNSWQDWLEFEDDNSYGEDLTPQQMQMKKFGVIH